MEFIGLPIDQEEFDYRFCDFWNIDYSDIKDKQSTYNQIDENYSKII
jgi:hypothetical protein